MLENWRWNAGEEVTYLLGVGFLSGVRLIFSPLQMAEMFRKNFEMGSQRAAKWQKGNLKVAVESFFS